MSDWLSKGAAELEQQRSQKYTAKQQNESADGTSLLGGGGSSSQPAERSCMKKKGRPATYATDQVRKETERQRNQQYRSKKAA
jgi:hypothetical protein